MRKKISFILILLLAPVLILSSGAIAGPDDTTEQNSSFFDRPEMDSVVWENLDIPLDNPKPNDTDREWPGERMGLIGPIVAEGGFGVNAYYVVYDATGALVGGIMRKEVRKHPEYLLALIMAAHDRSQITMVKDSGQGGETIEGGDAK
ncbi:MAG: hypothetical protein JRD89_12685 [Deltaproteobacteria bacterium]|nr:hypothetical protein [Deltaproteobacteria bacterium]